MNKSLLLAAWLSLFWSDDLKATQPLYESDIATTFTAETNNTADDLTPWQKELYERIENDPTLHIRIENGYVYFDSLGFAVGLEKKLTKSIQTDALLSMEYLDKIEKHIWLRDMVELFNLAGRRYLVTNGKGEKEIVFFSKINRTYAGEMQDENGTLSAIWENHTPPLLEERHFPLSGDYEQKGGNQLYTLDMHTL